MIGNTDFEIEQPVLYFERDVLLKEQAQLLQQLILKNRLVFQKLSMDENEDMNDLFSQIREIEYKISKSDAAIKKYIEKSNSILDIEQLSLINSLANENMQLLDAIKIKMQDQLKQFAQSLKHTRTSNKMIKAMPTTQRLNSTVEFNV